MVTAPVNVRAVPLAKKHVKMLPKFNVVYKHLYTMIGQMQIIMHLSMRCLTTVSSTYTTACFRTVKPTPTYTRRKISIWILKPGFHFKHIQVLKTVGAKDVPHAILALNEPVVLGKMMGHVHLVVMVITKPQPVQTAVSCVQVTLVTVQPEST